MLQGALRRLDALDARLHAGAAGTPSVVLDEVVPRLTRAADHGVLWMLVAAALAATGGDRRRAAARGLLSLGVASALANGPAKWVVRRRRPDLSPVPLPRRLRRQPRTSSFPSGHSASAAAFATGVALESPALGVPVGLLAAGVAYGRVHTGVHYTSDVAVGVVLGAGVALGLQRVWPVRPDRPAIAPPSRVDAPALPDGAGLVVVANAAAGSAPGHTLGDEVRRLLPAAEVVVCEDGDDVDDALREAARRARVLGVAGGDGTVNCAASAALEAGLPLAVIPAGTLNHFAAELGQSSLDELAEAIRAGTAAEVVVGSAGDGAEPYFLNTFAVGVYPELVRRRERREEWLGKWPSLAVALVEVLRHAQPLDVDVDGRRRRLWLLFAGNGRYHPAGFAPSWRERLDDPRIDVRLVDAAPPWSRTRLVLAVLTGRLGRSSLYEERLVDRLVAHVHGDVRMARDGEEGPSPARLALRTAPNRLVVYRPTEA